MITMVKTVVVSVMIMALWMPKAMAVALKVRMTPTMVASRTVMMKKTTQMTETWVNQAH